MTNHEMEVLNRAGQKVLDIMKATFRSGFNIIGSDLDSITVGDGTTNIVYARKDGKVLGKHTFTKTRKLSRKV